MKKTAVVVFFLLLGWLLLTQTRAVDWGKVATSLAHFPLSSLLGASALTLLSLALYSCFDLLGRHNTGHTLRAPTVMRVTFICYMFNLNLGSLVGAVAMRYRLYARLGLDIGTITQVLYWSLLTNWVGYLLLAGVIFGFQTPTLAPGWDMGSTGLQRLGFALLAMALLYLLLCALFRQRRLTLWGRDVSLPSFRLAALQLAMGAANWLLMGGVMFMALQQRIGFTTVVGVLLLAAVASFMAHIPAGLGVLEAVFVVLLAHLMPRNEVLASVLVYRAIYYLAPLALAAVLYLVAEVQAKRTRTRVSLM